MTLTADPVLKIGATFHPVSINERERDRFLTTMDFKTNVLKKTFISDIARQYFVCYEWAERCGQKS